MSDSDEFDLFISYAHADNASGWLTALVEAIKAEHAKFSAIPLKIFFDQDAIQSMDDWEHRILKGIRQSKIMLAALSPAYFQSEYCRKEWEIYLDHELEQAMPGEAIAPIYIATYEAFEEHAEGALNEWMRNLKRRQYVDVRNWWVEGPPALERYDVRQRLELMDQQIGERLDRVSRVKASPTTIPDHNRNFVGRIDELRRLREILALGRVGAIATLHGIGGIGKSALAFEYGHAYADDYPDGRFLVSCEGETDLRVALLKLTPQLDIQLSDVEQRDLELAAARVKAVLSSRKRTLIILDNVDDPRLLAPQQCSRYLPSGKVHVLATTRLGPDRLPGTECLPLDALSEMDAVRLLEKHRPFTAEDRDAEWKAALRIVRRLGGHALAIEVVAVYLWQNPDVSYEGFLERLQEEGLEAIEGAAGDDFVQLSRHHEKVVGNLLEPTLAALSAEELAVLELAALLPPDNIALSWLQQLTGAQFPDLAKPSRPGHPDPWKRLTRRLLGLRLVTANEGGLTCRMHRLVQDVVARRIHDCEQQRLQIETYVRDRAKQFWEGWLQHESRWELLPLVDYAHLALHAKNPFGSWLASQLSEPLKQLGRYIDARNLLRKATTAREEEYAPDHPKLASVYSNLAMLESSLGDLETARELLEKAIAIWKNAGSRSDKLKLAVGYLNMSGVQRGLGNYSAACKFAERAIRIWESARVPDKKSLAAGYSTLAVVLGHLAEFERARDVYRQAMSMKEQLYGPDHPKLASGYIDIANIERSLGNYAAAKELYERANAINEKVYEPDNPNLANGYAGLATVAKDLADYPLAQEMWQRSIAIREKSFDADHRSLATSYIGLANAERDLAHFARARELHERALEIRRKAYAADHPSVAASYASLAALEQELAHYAPAREWYERAREIYENAVDKDRPAVTSVYSGLGSLQKTLAQHADARMWYDRSLQIRLKIFAPQHAQVASSYSELAGLELELANFGIARQLYEQSLAIRRAVFDSQHPTLASGLAGLASLEKEQGNLQLALELTRQALQIREKLFDAEHPTLASSYSALAGILWERGERGEAQQLHQRALAIREKVFEPTHPSLASSFSALASIERTLGNLSAAHQLFQRALEIRQHVFAPDHPLIASSYVGLASVERALGQQELARERLLAALEIDQKAYGPDHTSVARDLSNLAYIAAALGQRHDAITWMQRAWTIRCQRYGPDDKRTAVAHNWLNENAAGANE